MEDNKWKWISGAVFLSVLSICFMIAYVNSNPFDIRFTSNVDDETVELVKAGLNRECLNNDIEICELSCKKAFDRYTENIDFGNTIPNTQYTAQIGNWNRADCHKLCFEWFT